uniref:Late lactation protein B-like n=1 Tax=Monodelphis domestica TaxID=13616 RepID=F7FF58_MONDO
MKNSFLIIALSLFSILQPGDSTSSEKVFESSYNINAIVGSMEFTEEISPKILSPFTISRFNDGNAEIRFNIRHDGKCEEVKLKLEKTDDPWKFTIDEGKHQVWINKTSVPDHWIIICESELVGEHIRMAKLLGPNSEAKSTAINEFKEFIHNKGLDEKKIIFPKQNESCIPEHAKGEENSLQPQNQ